MHVVQVIAPAPVGGLETVVTNLVDGLIDIGVRVTIVATLGPEDPLPEVLKTHPSATVVTVRGSSRRPDREYREVTRLVHSADLIHTHGYRPDIVQGILGRSLPMVSTVHGFTGGGFSIRAYEQLQLRALRDFSAVVAVSHPLARTLETGGVPPERIVTIPNAIQRPDFLSREEARRGLKIPPSTLAIGWIGRMSDEKDPALAVEAFQSAQSELPRAELIMIGDGPLRKDLEARGGDDIRFLGEIRSAGRYMRGLDALVLSSRTEGTPIVLIEAMWAGTPILATRVGGVPHLLATDQAVMVSPDSRSELAAAMTEILRNRPAALARAERALDQAQRRGDVREWVGRYRALYARLCNPHVVRRVGSQTA